MKIKSILKFLAFKLNYPNVQFLRPYKWGGTFYSQDGQDLILSALILPYINNEMIEKLFVDVGANHPTKYSNSFFLEKYFNFKTIAIDPQKKYQEMWDEKRNTAEFINVAVGESDEYVDLQILDKYDMFSSIVGAKNKINNDEVNETVKVKQTTLAKIFNERKIKNVGVLSIDVEGYEQQVIKGIDFDECNISIIIIENNHDGYFGSDDLRKSIVENGYTFLYRVGWLDDIYIKNEML
jgi:FkbM family methyltransferase